ncbi:MAG: putative sugar nucleotidyl transferase [Phycisphaerales bacterium]
MRQVFVFEDGKGLLSPLTDLRLACEVRTGALTLLERLGRILSAGAAEGTAEDVSGLMVPPALAPLARERPGLPINDLPASPEPLLAINGRCVDPHEALTLAPGEALVEAETGDLVAAVVRPVMAQGAIRGDRSGLRARQTGGRALLGRPWHTRSFRDHALDLDSALLLAEHPPHAMPPHITVIGDAAVAIAPSARVWPTVILDATAGEIVIAEEATVRPGAILIGPCYIGPHSTILERATIRAHTAVGPWCKVNGEVSGVIFQGYANKAHDGFLGDSWVGEWANLGAGTTNSNLLNTYGEVIARAAPGEGNERTGEQFLGAVIGDHVKTAICTRIMTGAVIHTGTMWAATAPVSGAVPPFTWATDEARRQFRLSRFLEVARAAMARRGVTPSAAYEARLADVHGRASEPAPGASGA